MSSGLGTSGMRQLVLRRRVRRSWNEAAQHEDRLAVLDRGDAAHGKTAAVAGAVDVVDDRRVRRRRRAGSTRAASARVRSPSTVACAADSAWPSTWPPNTYLVPMSRLWPRNRLSSRRSSVSRSTSSETTGMGHGRTPGSAGPRLWTGRRASGRCRRSRRAWQPARAVPREQRAGIALAIDLQARVVAGGDLRRCRGPRARR